MNRSRMTGTLANFLAALLCVLSFVGSAAWAAPFAYVANNDGNSVSVIDTSTNTVTTTIGVSAPFGVAVRPDGKYVYATNYLSSSMSVIDASTNSIVATVTGLGGNPLGIAITPNGTRAYVTNYRGNSVSVVDTGTNMVVATVTNLDPVNGSFPNWPAATPDGTRVYVPNCHQLNYNLNNTVAVIDTSTNIVTAVITVPGLCPGHVVISPDSARAYVTTCTGSCDGGAQGLLSTIDTATNTVIASLGVGNGVNGVALSPDGSRAYVANSGDNTVSVVDTASNSVINTITGLGNMSVEIAVTPDGTKAYVGNNASNTVSVIDTASNAIVATVPVGAAPLGIAITPLPLPPTPKTKQDCMNQGWIKFGFRNQGQCIQFVQTGK
ncbi:beta-propeller fold lactonase family protein [Lacisediminimonas profundi]|uniref:beta-propeller fold lactonase family protein n=1 Tax=Lacisediminimonas profundi TaxID=2603856 RepID=UPI00124B384F|nr:YncE family protein [Lacisediminimonas profundi]